MKTKIASLITILAMSFAVTAQIDRSKMPEPGPAPQIKIGEPQKFTLKNGLTVLLVENHKLPRISASLTIDNPLKREGKKAGLSGIMGGMLGSGTKNISKDDFNERVDYMGAALSIFSSGAYASSLTRYFPEVLTLLSDGIKNPIFTKEEFDKQIKIALDGIKSDKKDPGSIASRVQSVLTYGRNHPYGEYTTEETYKNLTLEDVKKEYNTYYKPNNAYLVLVGDIKFDEAKKLVKNLFEDWKKGDIPTLSLPAIPEIKTTEINFIDVPNAVQSEVAIINAVDFKLSNKDYFAAMLANQILGGGGTARLFMNLREDKGYTYGSYSSISHNKNMGRFKAYASVRNMVTDSAAAQINYEINKIRYQKVSEEELKNAKEKFLGSFIMNVQKPNTIANFALNKELHNLPKDFYQTYIEKINAVTVDDVQDAAIKYFKGDKARIIISGKAIDVLKNLEKNEEYTVKYFDQFGYSTSRPETTIPLPEGVNATSVIDTYFSKIGNTEKVKTLYATYEANMQGTAITLTKKLASPNKMSLILSVMGQVFSKQTFNGEKGFIEAQGQKKEMPKADLDMVKTLSFPFEDFSYKKGTLERIEAVDGVNAYIVKYGIRKAYYNVKNGLKIKEEVVRKGPEGKEFVVPTKFSDYKEVDGILIPHSLEQSNGQFTFKFKLKDIKFNADITDKDFE